PTERSTDDRHHEWPPPARPARDLSDAALGRADRRRRPNLWALDRRTVPGGVLTYGVGFALVSSVVESRNVLSGASAEQTTLSLASS
ncbi:MAG: hypothetical protein ACRDOY_11865, partial [Nocardioidaceae bacterium]